MSSPSKEFPLDFDQPVTTREAVRPVSSLEQRALRKLLSSMQDPPIAFKLWSGEEVHNGSVKPEVVLHIHDPRALRGLLTNPDLHFGDAYSDGTITVDGDLLRLIELASRYRPGLADDSSWLGRLMNLFVGSPRANTLLGSKQNIHHHYDLSNDFYELWLDPAYMQYTCAYFPHPAMTLEQAQIAKMEHVCRKLRLKPDDTLVEAGCGWGGLACYVAEHYGARVKAYNISHQQVAYATRKAEQLGLADRVTFIEDDYRNISGDYDVFASIGMLEHVGPANYRTLGAVIDRCLKPDGRALIHSIGRNQPRMMNRWIEKRIFPGAYPPSLKQMMEIFEPRDFSILDVENLRLHYAKTLQHWLQRFEDHRDRVEEMFDARFVRAWRLYLTGSISAFQLGDLQLFQVVFQRGDSNDLPWSREHLYRGD